MFIEQPANKRSLAQRKLVFGIGINDADYKIEITINCKRIICPYYRRWHNMLRRCYSIEHQEKQPTYIDCTVCDEWLIFSKFRSWMTTQDWKNKQLDKDLLFQGNKIYSPAMCLFVSSQINTLLNDSKANRGDYHVGVSWNKRLKKFQAHLSINGNRKHLGLFSSPDLASKTYKKAKYALIKEVALQQSEPLKSALLAYKIG